MQPSGLPVDRRARRAKTDMIDAEMLLRTLMAWLRGEPRVCSMVPIPSEADEEARRAHRERGDLTRERRSIVNKIDGILATLGPIRTSQPDFDALNSSGLVSRNFTKSRPSGRVRSMVILGARTVRADIGLGVEDHDDGGAVVEMGIEVPPFIAASFRADALTVLELRDFNGVDAESLVIGGTIRHPKEAILAAIHGHSLLRRSRRQADRPSKGRSAPTIRRLREGSIVQRSIEGGSRDEAALSVVRGVRAPTGGS